MKAKKHLLIRLVVIAFFISLLACGSSDNDSSLSENSNIPPIANAGSNQSVDKAVLVTLDASASNDSDGTIVSYQWSQSAGTAVALSDNSVVSPTFTSPTLNALETLMFQVTISDNDGATATATTEVVVNPVKGNEVATALLEDSLLINELYFEYQQRLGDKVWVMGYFGNTDINEDGDAFLVDNVLRLEVDEAFPHHTFLRLDGVLPPDSWQGDMIMVYGEIKDYATESGEMSIQPTPLITVEKYSLLKPFEQNNSWDNIFLKFNLSPENSPKTSDLQHNYPESDLFATLPTPQFKTQLTGTQAQDCDRAVIISGGVDKSNNHKRYENNVVAKFNKMKDLGFTDEQIEVFYNDGGEISVNGSNIVDQKTTNEEIKAHFEKLANDMPGSCTLTIFVTDHGIGNNQQQGYVGARPAFSGDEANNGKLHDENTFTFDARTKTRVISDSFVFQEQTWLIKKDETGNVFVYKWNGEQWIYRGENSNGDNIVSETELGGLDINGDGDTTDSDWGIPVSWLIDRSLGDRVYYSNSWDTDGDGKNDVLLRWDGERYVAERLVGEAWQEMGRDINGDYFIDIIDGGVDWNLDGDKTDQIAFHEGINLWGKEVLWDDAFRDLLKPLSDGGVHIMMEMVSCFSGGFVPNVKDLVENIYTGSSEDTKHFNRLGADGKYFATDEMTFLDNLVGIDTDSWNAAAEAATAADDKLAEEQEATKNIHVHEQTTRFATNSLYQLKGDGQYQILLDLPDDLVGQIYDFEFILGLQKPRWIDFTFPEGLPEGLQIEDIPGGVRVFSDNPIKDELIFTIAPQGINPESHIRIEYTDAEHKRLGYTVAESGSFETLAEQISFAPEETKVCVNHTDHGKNSPSIMEWLLAANILDKSEFIDIALTIAITTPDGSVVEEEIVLNAQGLMYLFLNIFTYGDYSIEVIGARHVPSEAVLELAGQLLFAFTVTAEETNKDQCEPD
ncbi:PKD domain-containing protein [Paraglaciecola arctica]|uniref:PKD domain-containing protein n=1 Tax=Paraglaciecola arctica TaxID=1128911 RepID=UPI001C076204|nr:PKD domain-containing protein [Paraglaciecola arctica]MBU3002142.1 PKD domain-containing protein [Paraglaciecola arctica]